MRLFRSARARWNLILFLWAVTLAVGFVGFRHESRDSGVDRSNLEIIYILIQMATLDSKANPAYINWQLQVARFVLPVLAASTLLQTASLVFVDQFRKFRLRYVDHHTVICGLGDIGTRLALSFAARGDTVVALEADPTAPGIATVTDADITVLVGDPSDPGLLGTARIAKAARLVAVTDDDATNIQIALNAVDLVGDRPDNALRCAVHLTNAELATLLRAADLDGHRGVRVGFFNTHERAARALLAENPPFTEERPPTDHVAVFGLGQLGRSLVVNVAQQWVERAPGEKLRITLVDPAATGRWQALRLQHPALITSSEATLIDLDFDKPNATDVDALRELFGREPPTWIAVVFADESLALSTAFFISQSLGVRGTPLIVRTRTEAGLGALLIPGSNTSAPFANIRAFPFLDRTCTIAAVDGGVREQLAQAVHDDYLSRTTSQAGDQSLQRPWNELTDDQQDLSRRRVDGIIADLDAVGCELTPLRRWGEPATEFDHEELEVLASREHQRWFDDRRTSGWTYGAIRDNASKKNPMLMPWTELSEDARDMNRASAAALTSMLARAGFEPARR